MLDLLLVGVLGFLHVPVDDRLCGIEDLMPLALATTWYRLSRLLQEMQRLATSFYMIDVSDELYLQLKKGIALSAYHHSSVTATVSS